MKEKEQKDCSRRDFLKKAGLAAGLLAGSSYLAVFAASVSGKSSSAPVKEGYDWTHHKYGMLIDLEKCIGCGHCVQGCKLENNVPRESFTFRTWVERYIIKPDEEVRVDSPNGGMDGFPADVPEEEIFRSFFVPKICNQCKRPPCVQACPVGATYRTKDNVVLVDKKYCIGCRYCIEACPYGARYFHPKDHVADKCTFCYHRITKGLRPACVETCPQNVRIFGDLEDPKSELVKILRRHPVQILKPSLNTEPSVYYLNLDREVL